MKKYFKKENDLLNEFYDMFSATTKDKVLWELISDKMKETGYSKKSKQCKERLIKNGDIF